MIQTLFQLYAKTPLSLAIRDSSWAFAVIEVFHLIALATFGGALFVAALRLIGPAFRFAGPGRTWAGLRPLIVWSLLALVVSGVLLVGSNPMKYYFNEVFRRKMALLALAVIATAEIDRQVRAASRGGGRPSRAMAAVGLFVWLGVGLAGRLIGLL